MRDIRLATAQFENRDNDKAHNLERMRELVLHAAARDAEVVCFHECCIPGYTWVQPVSREELWEVAESVPDGPSVQTLVSLAKETKIDLMAGLFERGEDGQIYNTYVAVNGDGLVARHRKIQAFVNPHLASGNGYTVFEMRGCKFGMLICYDNNLPENARVTALMGAEVIVAPHVTCGLPSKEPGRGVIERTLWDNRHQDPVRLRQEFVGPKGRAWLMRWLPARAWENGVYYVFSNPIGWDYDTVKPGLAMILDPFGEVLAESHELENDAIVATLTAEKLPIAAGRRYTRARRPELYEKLVEPQESVTEPSWSLEKRSS
ncbi:MAG: nitrilase family protein [Planctomycetales bacterium]|nr:nitrilase family protein [Planctomycetales bacterium]